MAVVRKTIRHVDQKLSIPWDPTVPDDEQCKKIIIDMVKDAPSEWGIMVSDTLLSFSKDDLVSTESHGNELFITFHIKASYETLGYRPGDVLFGVNISPKQDLDKMALRVQYKEVNILGLPFQICVKTSLALEKVNIIIDASESEGGLTYFALPAYYPHYTPLVATLASPKVEEEPFYRGPEVDEKWISKYLTKENLAFLDPLAWMTTQERRARIVADIKRMLSTGPGYKAVSISNIDLALSPTLPSATTQYKIPPKDVQVFIEFFPLKSLADRGRALSKEGRPYTFIYVPSIVLPVPVVASVVWFSPTSVRTGPTADELTVFEGAVNQYIKMKLMEAESLPTVLKGGPALKEEWLATGKLLSKKLEPAVPSKKN
jgi:hypothetical protein